MRVIDSGAVQLGLSESERELQAGLRSWLATVLPSLPHPPKPEDWAGRRRFDTDWQRRLYDAGYAGISWPRAYGGREASPTEQLVFLEEMARSRAPNIGVNFVGQLHAGPTLIAEASEEQKAFHLPAILRGDHVWCQGFSEPAAGSDLAALRCRAVRDGDEYVIAGQKIWSSFAQVADYAEVLVRTDADAPKHKGISWLIVPMQTAGIEIRPIRTAAGSSEFSEVFFDDVRVPVGNRVGEENDGWRVAMVTFAFERGTGFVGEVVEAVRLLDDIVALARQSGAWADDGVRADVGRLAAVFDALWALTKRNVSEAARSGVVGPGGSVLKLELAEAAQALADLGRRVLGPAGLTIDVVGGLDGRHVMAERLRSLALSIGGGTSQIQRNVIAERLLGLPKEPPWTSR
jgi:alkylation response protein AidB-like acyl-CoA dehydrogenase